jgi:FAD-dependent urate hydroxylase
VTLDVTVLGAGPYGLATAAYLQNHGLETRVFGEPMSFWRRHMPEGMVLRSSPRASNIADPARRLSLVQYAEATGSPVANPLPLDDFLAYADWFREQASIDVDTRRVTRLAPVSGGFRLELDDGETIDARRAVVAAGIARFARRPRVFAELDGSHAVHSVDIRSMEPFRGRRVVVVGAGQSALETAGLLHEAGAEVEVVARAPRVRWIPKPAAGGAVRRLQRLGHAPTEVGPRGLSWVAALPDVFRRMPRPIRAQVGPVCIAPMGGYWLRPRLHDVPLTLGREVLEARRRDGKVLLRLSDGESREVDHVVLGTGFHVDVRQYEFLAPELVQALRLANGSPVLGTGAESSVPGLHFVGAPAAHTFGPVMRFVVGTAYAAPALTRHVLGRPSLPIIPAW